MKKNKVYDLKERTYLGLIQESEELRKILSVIINKSQ